jgi:hypothetical protein
MPRDGRVEALQIVHLDGGRGGHRVQAGRSRSRQPSGQEERSQRHDAVRVVRAFT